MNQTIEAEAAVKLPKQKEEQIIVPFRYGRGKTGNAQHGEQRALIVDTDHYPNAFDNFRRAIKDSVKNFTDPEAAYQKSIKWLLTTGVDNEGAHVQEMQVGRYNLVFLNIQKLKSAPFQYLSSLTINGEKVYL